MKNKIERTVSSINQPTPICTIMLTQQVVTHLIEMES